MGGYAPSIHQPPAPGGARWRTTAYFHCVLMYVTPRYILMRPLPPRSAGAHHLSFGSPPFDPHHWRSSRIWFSGPLPFLIFSDDRHKTIYVSSNAYALRRKTHIV